MSHQIIITMTDEQYAALATAAQQKGQPIEVVAQETLAQQYKQPLPSSHGYKDLLRHMHADGDIMSLPTGEIDHAEEAELERLIQSIGPGKSVAEMIAEDRGPY